MEAPESGEEPFVTAGEPCETCRPNEAALDDSTAWQEHNLVGPGVFDDREPNALLRNCFGWSSPD